MIIEIAIVAIVVLLVVSFAASILALAAVGNLHRKAAELGNDIAAVLEATNFQSRVTRKMIRTDLEEYVYPKLQIEYPKPPAAFTDAMEAFKQIGVRRG